MKRWLLVPLVLSLFGLAFVESWAALVQAAEAAGIPYPIPWPFMVDGFIVAAALLVVEARRTGHAWGAWWPRLGLLGATALSTTIQVAYAPIDNWSRVLHGWSPIAVLTSFECLVWLVFSTNTVQLERKERAALLPYLQARLGRWDGAAPAPPAAPERPQQRPQARTQDGFTTAQVRRVTEWTHQERSGRWMAEQLGLSDRARKEKLAPLIERIKVSQNGGPHDTD